MQHKRIEIHIHSFWYRSFLQDCGSLAKQTNSPCFRLLVFNVSYTLSTFFNSIKHYHKSYIRCYERVWHYGACQQFALLFQVSLLHL